VSEQSTLVACFFSVRTQVTPDPTYRYERIHLRVPDGSGNLQTPHPPQIGDQIWLAAERKDGPSGEFRVIARSWHHPDWGSMNWPFGKTKPIKPPHLQIMLEACEGLFLNEAPSEDNDE
jgi:hypothetical protein